MELQNIRLQQFRRQSSTNIVNVISKSDIIITCISILLAFMAILAMLLTATPSPKKTSAEYQSKTTERMSLFINTIESPYKCNDRILKFQIKQQGEFWIFQNVYIAVKFRNVRCSAEITYVTHGGDLSFFHHLPEVAKRWKSPISAALYAPGTDFKLTLTSIQYVRHCIPESKYIRDFVTFHIFFPHKHMPTLIKMPHTENMALGWKFNCKNPAPYANLTAIKQTYAKRMKLPYPVNVARNIARRATNTYLILVSDIIYIPISFAVQKYKETENCIMIVSVFEWKLLVTEIPNRREDMKKYIKIGSAAPMKLNVPVYIASNFVANYDERLNWEENELHSKMQFYGKCLQGYGFTNDEYIYMIYRPTTNVFQAVSLDSGIYIGNTSTKILLSTMKQEYLELYGKENEKQCEKFFPNKMPNI